MNNINKQLVELPDGIYNALWSAYRMEILVPNSESVYVETTIGVKGINCKQKVKIKDKLLSTVS
jgi:hypothetical protein